MLGLAGGGGGGAAPDLARAIWCTYGRSSLPRFSWPECLAQAGLRHSRRSKMQIMFLPHAVLHRLASAQLLARRASVLEHRLKGRWNSKNRGSGCLTRVSC
jgi:hypothetical protein